MCLGMKDTQKLQSTKTQHKFCACFASGKEPRRKLHDQAGRQGTATRHEERSTAHSQSERKRQSGVFPCRSPSCCTPPSTPNLEAKSGSNGKKWRRGVLGRKPGHSNFNCENWHPLGNSESPTSTAVQQVQHITALLIRYISSREYSSSFKWIIIIIIINE